jgi:peroxiredoxin
VKVISSFALVIGLGLMAAGGFLTASAGQAQERPAWSEQEKPLADQLGGLRQLSDADRVSATRRLALQIRQLPATGNKLRLALGLAGLSTEGDFGHETLQEVARTLADALREQPQSAHNGEPAYAYIELAKLVRYEHVQAALDNPQFADAMTKLESEERRLQHVDFTLTDLHGKTWSMKDLRGMVVLVNFWATWCPPCRKEMPDLDGLFRQFGEQGLVILAVSDEPEEKVKPFIEERNIRYPILLDPDRKINTLFQIDSIPMSFLYDREGNLAAHAIDMRTKEQFLAMLKQTGLK